MIIANWMTNSAKQPAASHPSSRKPPILTFPWLSFVPGSWESLQHVMNAGATEYWQSLEEGNIKQRRIIVDKLKEEHFEGVAVVKVGLGTGTFPTGQAQGYLVVYLKLATLSAQWRLRKWEKFIASSKHRKFLVNGQFVNLLITPDHNNRIIIKRAAKIL